MPLREPAIVPFIPSGASKSDPVTQINYIDPAMGHIFFGDL